MKDRDLEHPDITYALRTGYPCGKKEQYPVCPVCGQICTSVYTRCGNASCEIVGCDECLTEKDAWEVLL